jgi:hypothetical protein
LKSRVVFMLFSFELTAEVGFPLLFYKTSSVPKALASKPGNSKAELLPFIAVRYQLFNAAFLGIRIRFQVLRMPNNRS